MLVNRLFQYVGASHGNGAIQREEEIAGRESTMPPSIPMRSRIEEISQEQAHDAKIENIIEIGVDFSGMMRVFEQGSNAKIIPKLRQFFKGLGTVSDKATFDSAHGAFCAWFTQNVHTATKTLKNGRNIPSIPCSYGHAAKVLDIATKVYVYYCGQPSAEAAARLVPLLHSALDTPMMLLLDSTIDTIQQVDRAHYERLQGLVTSAIAGRGIVPVQYDDVMWRRVQRG